MIRCRLAERYRKWAGLEPEEPTWGWIWSIALHLVVFGGLLLWTAIVMWLLARLLS